MVENKQDLSNSIEGALDWESIVRDVLRQWWVILLGALAGALFFGAYGKISYQPEYTASCTFIVGKSGFSSNAIADNLTSAKKMTERFSQVAGSHILQKEVCEELGTESFEAQVTVSAVEESNLMTLNVTAGSPRDAYLYIRSVMDNTVTLSAQLAENISVRVLKEPVIPAFSSNPLNIKGGMIKAAAAAGAVTALLFALLSYVKDTVKNEEDVKNKIDTKHLGTIYFERKYKTRESAKNKKGYSLTIDNPALSFTYAESVRMAATRVRRELDKKGAQVLMVTSVSENEGKSTVAANLALALQQEGQRTLLMDCDFRKPAQYKIFELSQEEMKNIDFGTSLKNKEAVQLLKSGREKKLPVIFSVQPHRKILNRQGIDYLQKILNKLKKQVDYIIIDSSPLAFVSDAEALANIADASLLVIRQDLVEACYINDAIDRLNATQGKVLGCLYNSAYRGFFGKSREYGYYYGGYGRGNHYRYGGRHGGGKQSKQSKGQVE